MGDGHSGGGPRPITPLGVSPTIVDVAAVHAGVVKPEAMVHASETTTRQWVIDQEVIPRSVSTPFEWPSSWPLRPWRERGLDRPEDTPEGTPYPETVELLEAFGFRVREIREDIGPGLRALFVAAALPAGWRKVPSNVLPEVHVQDERGLLRAEIAVKITPSEQRASMHLTDAVREMATEIAAGFVEDVPLQILTDAERADLVHHLGLHGAQKVHDVAATLEHEAGQQANRPDWATKARELADALRSAANEER